MGLLLIVGAGALVAGFVSGLAGFGTGLVALGIRLEFHDLGGDHAFERVDAAREAEDGQVERLIDAALLVPGPAAQAAPDRRQRPRQASDVWLGLKSYGQIDERQFRAIVLWLLLGSGLTLTASNLL